MKSVQLMPTGGKPKHNLKVKLISARDVRKLALTDNILGSITLCDGYAHDYFSRSDTPSANTHLLPPASRSIAEVWISNAPVSYENIYGIQYAYDGKNLFGCITYSSLSEGLSQRTQEAYRNLFKSIGDLGYPKLVRIWNYIPDIVGVSAQGEERYRIFCKGRSLAFRETFNNDTIIPAATGIGSRSGDVCIYFIATKETNVIHIENPLQTPAYKYPKKFGAFSPSFSRATFIEHTKEDFELHISGTASIRAAETIHIGDVEKQTETTLENIKILIGRENLRSYGIDRGFDLKDLTGIKVYVKHEQDFLAVRRSCNKLLPNKCDIIYLHGDICRPDLLVEIEAVISSK